MPRNGSGVYSLPAGTAAVNGLPAESADVNSRFNDLESDMNVDRPISAGGTGASSVADAKANLGISSLAVDVVANYSAAADGSADDTSAFTAMRDDVGWIQLPLGDFYINGTVDAETPSLAWAGLRGMGHDSVIRLGPSGVIQVQNYAPGGALGQIQYPGIGLKDVTIDGDGKTAEHGVIVGTNTDAGQTSIDRSCNGVQFTNVDIFNCEVGWACGFMTNSVWFGCGVRDCDYGVFIYTSTNSTASDIFCFNTLQAQSCDIANITVYSDTANPVAGHFNSGINSDGVGWGMVVASSDARCSYKMTGMHFENNGTEFSGGAVVVAPNVTVKDVGLTAEPGHLYVENSTIIGECCTFVNGFIHIADGGILHLRGGSFTAGTDASNHLNPFKNSASTGRVVFDGFHMINPGIDSDLPAQFLSPVTLGGTTNNRQYIRFRQADAVRRGALDIMPDPTLETTTCGWTDTSSAPTSSGQQPGAGAEGTNALRVQFAATAGGINANGIRFNSQIDDMAADEYLALAFDTRPNANTQIAVQWFNTEDNDNGGVSTIDLNNGETVRHVILWRNKTGATTTGNVLGIYATGADAARVDFSRFSLRQGRPEDVLPVLQGVVGQREPIGKSFTWDIPNTADGSSSSSTTAVSGAAIGDLVEVSGPWLAGMRLWGAVSANGTVTVTAENNTGGAVNPSSGTYHVLVHPR